MKTIVLDFETYYDNDFSLRKLTPVEYILDPRFETIGCAVRDDGNTFWLEPHQLVDYLAKLPPKVAVVSHNALFDMCILAWKFNYVPHMMIDTLGMARAWLGHELKSLSLNSVAMHLNLGLKGNTVHKVAGMGIAAIKAAGFYEEYAEYSCNDADLCWQIYRALVADGYPVNEIAVMDTVLRCAVQPKFKLDATLLAEHLHMVRVEKENLLQRTGLTSRDDLMSNDKFAEALRRLGAEPPMKTSLVTGKQAYAFAKTDPDFIEMEEHPDPMVQALVSARLGIKSTIEETRTERLMRIANLTWQGNETGLLPMPLRYSGAHTHRLSGDWKLNMQNLPARGNNKIRSSIVAPPGHQVLAVDSAQIEARIVAWFCGQESLVKQFDKGEDVYSSFASEVFGRPITKADKAERFIGKTAVLGLGYGLGWEKFQRTIKLQSKANTGQEIVMDDKQAQLIVSKYRELYSDITSMWGTLNSAITLMTDKKCYIELAPITIWHESIKLPSGLYLHFHDLQSVDGRWKFTYGGKPKDLYGGKMLENIVQALARICIMDAAIRIRKQSSSDVWLNLQVHDELVYVVPDEQVHEYKKIVLDEMNRRPSWAPDLPLASEAAWGKSFGDAK